MQNLGLCLLATGLFAGIATTASAQSQVTITPGPEMQQVADALGMTTAELEMELETELNDAYHGANIDGFLRDFANATAFVNHGIGVDYASSPGGFVIGAAVNASASGQLDEATGGGGATATFMAGMNLARWDHPQWTVYGNFFHHKLGSDAVGGGLSNVGLHGQYRLAGNEALAHDLVFRWSGIDITTGIDYVSWEISGDASEAIPVEGNTGSENLDYRATGSVRFQSSTFTIPLEVTTGVRIFYLASLYLGAATDLQFGKSKLDVDVQGDIIYVDETNPNAPVERNAATATVAVRGDNKPSIADVRGILGLQLNIWKLKLFGQLNISQTPAVGAAFGLRLVL